MIRDSADIIGHGFNPWRKFRDSQDGPGKRKESSIWSFYIFFMVLFFFYLSEFTLCFHSLISEENKGSSILLLFEEINRF